jgi:hypothetical protein
MIFRDRGRLDNSLGRIDLELGRRPRVMNILRQSRFQYRPLFEFSRAGISQCESKDFTRHRKQASLQGSFSEYGVLSSGADGGIRSTRSRSSINLKFHLGCNHENSSRE